MVRAALAEQPVREGLVRCTLHKFLQDGLVVAALLLSDLLALGVEQHAVNERACRADAAVEIDGRQHRLHGVGLDGGPGPAAAGRDFKTALQELVQRESGQVLAYRLTGESGPDHAKTFCMEVQLNGKTIGAGQGRSKKEAEQAAAKAAVASLEQDKA